MLKNHVTQYSTCNASNSASDNVSNRISIHRRRVRGVVIFYMTFAMIGLCAICSLGVDLGRVQLTKTELRRAADSAARAAAAELPDLNSAISFAVRYSKSNTADGSPIVLDPNADIEFGKWDAKAATFTKLAGFAAQNANCVHITLRRTASRGTAVPLLFAKVIGQDKCDVTAESYAMLVPSVNVDQNVPGTANPFLAGMPQGSVASLNNPHNSPDYAGNSGNPKQSPLVVSMPLVEGDSLSFDSIDGTVRHDPSLAYYSPDGELATIGRNTNGSENGISDLNAPINALVGLFLDDTQPNTSGAPRSLDFSSDASRNFDTLNPKLKQIFFIGDGKTSDGARQQFIVPKGATRLYLATWDFYEWNNNAGYRNIQVKRPQRIITVK
jgi:Flp pilus assembly protein TadG